MIKTVRVGTMNVARREVVLEAAGSGTAIVRSREAWRDGLRTAIGVQLMVGAVLIGWALVAGIRRGAPLGRPAFAASIAVALVIFPWSSALAVAPSGDLNADGRLDAADALLAERIATGSLAQPTSQQQEDADVAPLELAPDGHVGPDDALLVIRGAWGEDIDSDGLDSDFELGIGASPFRADTDRDGLDDDVEVAQGLDPTVADGDQDGLSDGEEIAAGTNAFEMDSDGDGIVDGRDGTPTQFTDEQIFFLHTDHLGGTAVVTDLSKAVVRKVYYGIWGDIRSDVVPASAQASLSPREGFTGQSRDPGTELLYYGARFYDPESARFVQPDSVVQAPLNPQNLNRYAYVANDPLNMVDPTGNIFGGVFGSLGTAIGNVASTVGGWISAGFDAIGGFLSGVGSAIAAGFSAVGNLAAAAASRVDFHRAIFAALDAQAMAAIALERIRQLQRFSPVTEPAVGTQIAQASQSEVGRLLNEQYKILGEMSGLEEQLEGVLHKLRPVYEDFDRVTDPNTGLERSLELVGKAYVTMELVNEIRDVRRTADPILSRLQELDYALYENRLRIVILNTDDYRVVNDFTRRYSFPDRFMEFNSRVRSIERETLGSP